MFVFLKHTLWVLLDKLFSPKFMTNKVPFGEPLKGEANVFIQAIIVAQQIYQHTHARLNTCVKNLSYNKDAIRTVRLS